MKLSLLVPCYNEQEALPILYNAVIDVIDTLNCEYEMIFINDGSTDKTLDILREITKRDVHAKYISFSRNFGKEAAMFAGLCNSTGDYVAIMDADMQDPPGLLPEMIRILEEEEYDSVATRRASRTGEPVIRSYFAKKFYQLMNYISDSEVVDGARDFRLMKRKMVDAIISMGEYNRFSKGIFGWIGFKTCWLPYENIERVAGKTKWSFLKLFRYAMDGIINFSTVPLNLSSWCGMGMSVVSVVALIFIIVRKLIFGDPVDGWTSLVCIITFIGGVQLLSLGILGQYMARTYLESKQRPHYIIDESNIKDINYIR